MKVLVIGPSDTKSHGGIATVIRGIRESRLLNNEFEIDIFPSYIDGNLVVRFFYSVYSYFRFLLCYKRYDLFHIHAAGNGSTFRKYLYLRLIKKAGKKVIIHIHSGEYLVFYDRLGKFGKKIVEHFLQQADMVLALSNGWKQKFEERFLIQTCTVLNNGIDVSKFQTSFTKPAEHQNAFLMLGKLETRKGVYDLIDAIEIAVGKNSKLSFCLAGDGEIEKVQRLVKEKKLEKYITIPGWIDEKKKIEYLKNTSSVILASYHEGLPMCILEGMAAGKAIISTTVGAIPEVVAEENGILVEPGNVHSLAEALLKCSENLEILEDMSENNKKKAADTFSIERMHEQLAEYYRHMMK